ncbi:unnamed protein product [Parajaminaea phylloscopi]
MSTSAHKIEWDKLHPSQLPAQFMAFPSRRSQVMSTKGIAASAQPLASQAGIKVLDAGGNAADAAVAVAAALNVTEPCSTGIGGDAFCLFYDAATKKVRAFNGSGRAPQAMTLEKLREAGLKGGSIPLLSIHAATVPGAPALWVDAVEKLGSGKVDLAQVLAPAIELAQNGYPVHEVVANSWAQQANDIKNASPSANDMLYDGRAPQAGEIMTLPHLAQTFRELASKGKDGFYKGRIAEAIVELHKSKGGFMTLEDLANHAKVGSEEVQPISYTYRHGATQADFDKSDGDGVTLHECPPNGQGLTALIALGILDELQASGAIPHLSELQHNSAEYLHALIESLRLAFADTQYYVSDPNVVHVPVKELLSHEYLSKRAKLFNPKKSSDIEKGQPVSSSDTVYLTVVDKDGNACSFINSNYAGFGTCALPRDCGFTLQNRGAGFVLEEGHPNCVAPGKRPYHTIIPAMATKAKTGELYLSYGVMGGFMQPQGHVQVLLNLVARKLTVQQALDSPRFCIGAGMPPPDEEAKEGSSTGAIDSSVFLEEGISKSVVDELSSMGHKVTHVTGWERAQFGRGQVIQRIQKGGPNAKAAWTAGSDQRADGQAVAQI